MNISTLRTSGKGSTAPFGAAALNERAFDERSSLVTDKRSDLTEAARRSRAEPNSGKPDPLIQALVDRLPTPASIWSFDDRAKWLKAAAMVFNLIYKTE
jgi:hypothetical protein